jgi:succinoglycan biosynthesis protein ExoV
MKLYYWKDHPNFGDQLNPWLWPRLVDDIPFDDDETTLFVGIGSVLNERLPVADRVFVLGAGVGYENAQVRVRPEWQILCVRGPVSARKLGLPQSKAACDPGILVRRFWQRSSTPRFAYSYMPHWRHANELLRRTCEDAGVNFIDPQSDVETVMNAICASEVVITESLHGAICADAVGVPWVATATQTVYAEKWIDWAESMGVEYSPCQVIPVWEPRSLADRVKSWTRSRIFHAQLVALKRARPSLSDRDTLSALTCKLERVIAAFKYEAFAVRQLLVFVCGAVACA